MTLGPCLKGFKSYRLVNIVDDTHLKGKYKGIMLVDVAMDGNNQMYPLTYAIIENEIDRLWKWFMTNLKAAIGDCHSLVFVSNWHQTITNAVDVVFLTSYHELCTYHLKRNVDSNFKTMNKLFNSDKSVSGFHVQKLLGANIELQEWWPCEIFEECWCRMMGTILSVWELIRLLGFMS